MDQVLLWDQDRQVLQGVRSCSVVVGSVPHGSRTFQVVQEDPLDPVLPSGQCRRFAFLPFVLSLLEFLVFPIISK